MSTTSVLSLRLVAVGIVVLVIASPARLRAQQHPAEAVRIGDHDLGGVVTSAQGPEAGVWVIAETTELPTKFAKIVVTDAQGRYVMPDLPKANYSVWVRGYGLVDSPKVQATPGKILNLQAVVAPHAAAAAEYYPAIYWYAMLKIPDKSEFPGTGPGGNGMPPSLKSQADWLANVKTLGCMSCHALGTIGTRRIPKELGEFKDSTEAWARRITAGQAMTQMVNGIGRLEYAARAQIVRRLDRSHRRWRTAVREARAAARYGAQRRSHPVGLEPSHGLLARFDRDRPAQADALSPMASSTGRRKKARITRRSSIR